jgi:hypothetical protein
VTIIYQCCGSMKFWYGSGCVSIPLTNGSGSGFCYFRKRSSKFLTFFVLFEGTFT